MEEIIRFVIGMVILLLGIPIGNFLARVTKEELELGKKWFKMIVIVSIIGAFISLIFLNDFLMFSFLFIAIVTSRSLRKNKKKSS